LGKIIPAGIWQIAAAIALAAMAIPFDPIANEGLLWEKRRDTVQRHRAHQPLN
jgi:hypothetical protein